jgi:hypothetical protein
VTPQRKRVSPVVLDDTSDDEDPVQSSGRRRKSGRTEIMVEGDDEPVRGSAKRGKFSRAAVDADNEDEDEDDEDPIQSSVRRRRRRAVVVDIDSSSEKGEGKVEDDEATLPISRKRQDCDSDGNVITPSSERWGKSIQTPETGRRLSRRKPASKDNGFSSDDSLLSDSSLEIVTELEPRSNKKRKQFLGQLARLHARKRIKGGGPSTFGAEDEGGSDAREGSSEADGDSVYGLDGDLDAELEDFIEEDDGVNGLIGAPDVQIPLEFTSASRASNSTNFRVYAEYLIYDTLFPSEFRKNEHVINAVKRLNDAVSTFGDSVAESGAWKAEYIRALKARPRLVRTKFSMPEPHCDACNRRNQNCTDKVKFTGRQYNMDTLEDLSSDEDEELNETGEQMSPEDRVFYLGWTCLVRTENAHALAHWRKALKTAIFERLQECGYIDEDGNLLDEGVERMAAEGNYNKRIVGLCQLPTANIVSRSSSVGGFGLPTDGKPYQRFV